MAEAAPYTPEEALLLRKIREEVAAGLRTTREGPQFWACLNRTYYEMENHLLVRRRPAEEQQDWEGRPKRTSAMTRRAIELLCDHLYNPGPARTIEGPEGVDAWYQGVLRDNHADSLFQDSDEFSTLNGTVAFQVAATGKAARPIKIHLWDRGDIELWSEPDDPLVPFAICTIDRVNEQTTYTIWTRLESLVYRTKQLEANQTAGGRVAEFAPAESGRHGYGVLPFSLVHYKPPTQRLESTGLGSALRRANSIVDEALSDLAEAVRYYLRPIGFARNVPPDWRPRLRPGSFQALPGRERNAANQGAEPEPFYLQANLDVASGWLDITNYVNATFEECGVPLSAARMEQSGVISGVAIVAEQAPLLVRAQRRQRPAARYETDLARVVLAVGGAYYDRPDLEAASADPKLCLVWPEPRIPIPGPERDEEDQAELAMGLTSEVEILMRRRGMDRAQAIRHLRQVAEDRRVAAAIRGAGEPATPEPGDEDETIEADGPMPGKGPGGAIGEGPEGLAPEPDEPIRGADW